MWTYMYIIIILKHCFQEPLEVHKITISYSKTQQRKMIIMNMDVGK